MSRNVTIKDVAKELGISISTVSRALRDTYDVNLETRNKVVAMAKALNYRPNYNAKGLAQGKTHNIGVILPFMNNYYFSTVITGVQEIAYNENYNIIPFVTNDSIEKELNIIKNLNFSGLDGLLISSSASTSEHFDELSKLGIPVVFFDRVAQSLEFSKVTQDDFNGAFQGTEHLIKQGYTKIAHITGPVELEFTKNRKKGYLAALDKYNMHYCTEWIVHSGFSQDDGEKDTLKLLKLEKTPDAIFAVNDRKAIGAILALKGHEIHIGKDVGVIGFTNDPIASLISPGLSTMVEPALEIGRTSCELLLQHIRKSQYQPRDIVLLTSLIQRESTIRA